ERAPTPPPDEPRSESHNPVPASEPDAEIRNPTSKIHFEIKPIPSSSCSKYQISKRTHCPSGRPPIPRAPLASRPERCQKMPPITVHRMPHISGNMSVNNPMRARTLPFVPSLLCI